MRLSKSKILVLLALVGLLCACEFSKIRFIYNQADNFIVWMVSDALDLNSRQKTSLIARVGQWFAWHRQKALPKYAQWLRQTSIEAKSDISTELACRRQAQLLYWVQQDLHQSTAPAVDMLASVDRAQVTHLRAYLQERSDAFAEKYAPTDFNERKAVAQDFVLMLAEFFYGDFNRQQVDWLNEKVKRLPMDGADIHRYRESIVSRMLGILNEHTLPITSSPQVLQAPLQSLASSILSPTQEPDKSRIKQWLTAGCGFVADLHNQTTPTQRQEVSTLFQRWAKDFDVMAKENP
jgi:hypothetical protein